MYKDVEIQLRVDVAVSRGLRLPRWGWATPGPYNGATGAERVLGWQKLVTACRAGWLPWPHECSICGRDRNLHQHSENYFRPLVVEAVCRSCHFRVHDRFKRPEPWQELVDRYRLRCAWVASIGVIELSRAQARELATRADPRAYCAA